MAEKLFVLVEKGGERLIVHPSTVEAHKAAGWAVIQEGVALEVAKTGSKKDAGKVEEPAEPPAEPPAEAAAG